MEKINSSDLYYYCLINIVNIIFSKTTEYSFIMT